MDPINIVIEEWKALRAEIVLCLERRITILSYGLTAIGVLVGAGVTALDKNLKITAGVIAGLGIPLVAVFVLFIWLAETQRVRRASWYNWSIELRLEKEFGGKKTLRWEDTIRDPRLRGQGRGLFFEHYAIIIIFFQLVALGSAVWGVLLFLQLKKSNYPEYSCLFPLSVLGLALIMLLLVVSWCWFLWKARQLQDKFDTRPPDFLMDAIPKPTGDTAPSQSLSPPEQS